MRSAATFVDTSWFPRTWQFNETCFRIGRFEFPKHSRTITLLLLQTGPVRALRHSVRQERSTPSILY